LVLTFSALITLQILFVLLVNHSEYLQQAWHFEGSNWCHYCIRWHKQWG